MITIRGLMNELQADRVVKAIVDGVESYAEIAERGGIEAQELPAFSETLDRAIQLMSGFYKYGHENMKPVGLPPPPNAYLDKDKGIEEQCSEYYAFEAVQRNGMTVERAIWTCGQLGLDEGTALTALDNVAIPWRASNGWKTYAQLNSDGEYVLMDKPPVKLKRHIERILQELV
ncbi:hypothetical protein P4C99_08095 [Pontiellaceae bacterium B1224]|nr:hypothetical protein [Pontiellaceae bacterium B1224]